MKPYVLHTSLLACVACFVLAASADAQLKPPPLDSIKQSLAKASKSLEEEKSAALAKLITQYRTSLKDLEARFIKGGDLDSLLATRDEIARFDEEKTIPEELPDALPSEIARLRIGYREQVERTKKLYEKKSIDVTRQHREQMESLKKYLTTQMKIDQAVEVRDEISRMDALLAEQSGRSTNSLSGGVDGENPADAGSIDGERAKTNALASAHARDPKTALEDEPPKTMTKAERSKRVETLRTQLEQVDKHIEQRQFDEALTALDSALRTQVELEGTKHPGTASVYGRMAQAYYSKANYNKAIECNEKALKILQETLGEQHPTTANTYGNIGVAYLAQSETAKGREYINKAYQLFLAKAGESNTSTKYWKALLDKIKRAP